MSIKEKTAGQLIDELITTDLRCWFAQEDIMNKSLSEENRLQAAIRAQEQNAKRTELIRAIDSILSNIEFSNVTKTYHTYLEEKK
jgi:hypothetical protein